MNNNPLSYTDPSGFFLKKLFKKLKRFVKKFGATIIGVAMTLAGQPWYWAAMASSGVSAAVSRGNFLRNFVTGFSIGMITGAIGGSIAGGISRGLGISAGSIGGQVFRGALAGAVSGGLGAAAFGGDFWSGALGGAVTGGVVGGIIGHHRARLLQRAEQSDLLAYESQEHRLAMREYAQSPSGQRFLSDVLGTRTRMALKWSEDNGGRFRDADVGYDVELPRDFAGFRSRAGDPRATLATALAHESGHWYTRMKFGPAARPSAEGYVFSISTHERSEIAATRWENGFRLWSGIPARSHYYQDLSVPSGLCVVCPP